MTTFTPEQLDAIRNISRTIAMDQLHFPRVRSSQRESATDALARWLYNHRESWAADYLSARSIILPTDPGSPVPVLDRFFFEEFRFDANGYAVPRCPWHPRVDSE